ncbi:MAG TPA: hypothetical protein PKY82_19220 [Pyrinomonadaceae bacterium]|nr:hypothetical protein [Pyrinomonadaceae bacterium]
MEKTEVKCPKCQSTNIAEIRYGLPNFSDELNRLIEAGKVRLGGCEISFDNPAYFCNECQKEF